MLWGGVKDALGVCISTISAAREDSSSLQADYVAPQPCSAFPDLPPAPLHALFGVCISFPPPDCITLCGSLGSSQPWLGGWLRGTGSLAIILLGELSL